MTDITHNETQGRFACIVDGYHCELDYRLDGRRMIILHTGVPHQVGGRGVAAELTRVALETARSRGWHVLPLCSYAEAYMRRYPEYADLLE